MKVAKKDILNGIFPPLVTPLREDCSIDVECMERLIEHVLGGGVDGIFVLGTTGEGPGLSHDCRKEVVRLACREGACPAPVLVGITNSSYTESLRLARYAHEQGASAVVVAPPPYYVSRSEELIEYLRALARDCPLPIFLYNIPSHTHVPISWHTAVKASSIEGVVGYKDSSGDMVQYNKVLKAVAGRDDFGVMIGPEELAAESLLMGGTGAIPGGGNLFPALYAKLYRACLDLRMEDVRRLQRIVMTISELLYEIDDSHVRVIRAIKESLALMEICGPQMTFPYGRLEAEKRAVLAEHLQAIQSLVATID